MTNTSIKKVFLFFLLLTIIINIFAAIYFKTIDVILLDNGVILFLIPFIAVILIRIYNLLVYGRFVVEE